MLRGQGKSTYTFSAQCQRISAFRLLALTTEALRGAESGTLQNPYTLISPDPRKYVAKFCRPYNRMR
jgi:hypothetical protein